jgi:hypothetical protein
MEKLAEAIQRMALFAKEKSKNSEAVLSEVHIFVREEEEKRSLIQE